MTKIYGTSKDETLFFGSLEHLICLLVSFGTTEQKSRWLWEEGWPFFFTIL